MINTFQIGCDPEFVALGVDGKLINVCPDCGNDENEEECRKELVPEDGEIGWDHSGRVLELRPKPTQGTFALCRRLQRLVKDACEIPLKASKFRAGATCAGEMLGGHVHFGFPLKYTDRKPDARWFSAGEVPANYTIPVALDDKLVQTISALDKVTYILEHLDILPMGESANRRKGKYGKWGEIRDSDGHLEYRTMASWLYDPRVAFLCLTAAKLAAADPRGTLDALAKVTSFEGVKGWMELYKDKDANARRACEKVFTLGLKSVQVDPDVDFRERWKELGI